MKKIIYSFFAILICMTSLYAQNVSSKTLKLEDVFERTWGEIVFEFNKTNIVGDTKETLKQIKRVLKKNKQLKIEIGVHSDCRGREEYNRKLCSGRAKTIYTELIRLGIKESRLTYQGYGEDVPIITSSTNDCYDLTEHEHQINRRTEFVLLNYNR